MSRSIAVMALVTVTAMAGLTPAAPSVLQIIPQDAAAAVAVRNINDVCKKADQFAADAQLQSLPRPSQLFTWLLDNLGIRPASADLDASMALVLANPDLLDIKLFTEVGQPNWEAGLHRLLVLAVPVRDRDALAADFGIAKGALKPDTVIAVKDPLFNRLFFYLHGKHLFYGLDAEVVQSVATSPRAGAGMSAAQRRSLERADVLVQLNRKAIAPAWKKLLWDLETDLVSLAREDDWKVVYRLIESLGVTRPSWIVARLDGGLGLSWVNTFPQEGADDARRFLASLQRGAGPADLAGLPTGRVVAAEAQRGNGATNAAVARVAFAALWKYRLRRWGWVCPTDRARQVGVLTEIWKHLRGSRMAIYQNADRGRHGLYSAVTIFDTENAARFLDELRLLARLGNDLDLSDRDGRGSDVAAVQKLVRDLGDDEFSVRESASTRLMLVGEGALPYLEKALHADDAEVRHRAARIKESIVTAAVARRQELLEKDSLRHIHPSFGFARKPEMLDGAGVQVVQTRLPPREAAAAKALRELFGPGWDRIRLAVHGQQVIVLVGSDKDLLRAALTNLKQGKPGLASGPLLAAAAAHANPAHRAEFHLSLAAAQALWSGTDLARPSASAPGSLTSFTLTVQPEFLELDLWIPVAEARIIEQAWNR